MKKTLIAGFAALSLGTFHASAVNVTLELALLVDVSGSVDSTEYALQRDAYAAAFLDSGIQALIADSGPTGQIPGGIAVTYIEWSTSAITRLGWTHLDSAADATAFAAAIGALARPSSATVGTQTGPGTAINFAYPQFATNGFDGVRQVIDVSGDGSQNSGASTATARNDALAAGVDKINGLPILGSEANLLAWYQNNIQGGSGSFTLPANSFADFETAIKTKIEAEIQNQNPVPEGGPGVLLTALVLGALLPFGRRLKR